MYLVYGFIPSSDALIGPGLDHLHITLLQFPRYKSAVVDGLGGSKDEAFCNAAKVDISSPFHEQCLPWCRRLPTILTAVMMGSWLARKYVSPQAMPLLRVDYMYIA